MQTTGNLGLKKPEGTDIVDIADLNGNMDILDNAVNGKVDKVTGKQLSTNDYTAAEKTKLAGIATGANNYVHPNHTGDVTSTGDGVTAIAAGVIVDADVNAAAAIAWSKLSKSGASLADLPTRSATDLSSGTLAVSRLPAISGDITLAAGTGTAAITAGVIVNADVNATAAIDASKIGAGVVSNVEFGYLDGVTSGIQAQLNAKETPTGAQTKANTAEGNAKTYVDNKSWQKIKLTSDDGKSIAISGTDLNNLLGNGFYNGDNLTNSPDGTATWFYVEVQCHSNGSGYVLQKAHRLNGGINSFFMRTKENNVWGAWSADLFQSVANGKNGIASAISGKGIAASGSDSFPTLAAKIGSINNGGRKAFSGGWQVMQSNVDAPWNINVGFNPRVVFLQYRIVYGYYDVYNNYGYYDEWGYNTITHASISGVSTGIAANGYPGSVSTSHSLTTNGPDGDLWHNYQNRDKLIEFESMQAVNNAGSALYLTSNGFYFNQGWNFRNPGPGNWAGLNWAAYE
ncbi:hypothetical protein BSK59_25685 [Paenibacillus odorifer]|uniref:pyocin knob domain-containing protein n=1 Tax=Paenibacillus TaxID=44249 RepID=UPI00096D7653|nr:pyocin knob domain-containing protein [Paenibacillus odorifer]OME48660.1 hypothetical protein BSK59_25685 [Paenibacillus odorifer]